MYDKGVCYKQLAGHVWHCPDLVAFLSVHLHHGVCAGYTRVHDAPQVGVKRSRVSLSAQLIP